MYTLTKMMWKAVGRMDQMRLARQQPPAGVTLYKDIPYLDDGLTEQLLDVYVPAGTQDLLPTIVNVHGGGWMYGDKELYQYYGMQLSLGGFAVVNINYRLAPQYPHPAQLQDTLAALRWLRQSGASFFAHPEQVFLCGDSAGAYIAAMAICTCQNPVLSDFYQLDPPYTDFMGVGLHCGVYDLQTVQECKFPRMQDHMEMVLGSKDYQHLPCYPYTSARAFMTPSFPPTYLLSTENDGLFPETRHMLTQLEALHIPHQAQLWDKTHKKLAHVFHLNPRHPESSVSMEQMLAFFRQQLLETTS